MLKQKYLFVDRDGTLILEPDDKQVDSLEKLTLMPDVITALLQFQLAGFRIVIVSNQDGLGSKTYPQHAYDKVQLAMISLFSSQGVKFESVRICPHVEKEGCFCRKPGIGLLVDYLIEQKIDIEKSLVIGDRQCDLDLASNLGLKGYLYENNWKSLASDILSQPRTAVVERTTTETKILASINLDQSGDINIQTGNGFFDHMLIQMASHGGFSLIMNVKGDLEVDEHHSVEDCALVLGELLRKALGDKLGVQRYGFVLPMDEALAMTAIDLSGRPYCVFNVNFSRESIGGLPTEMVSHFFRSLATSLKASIHVNCSGENTHHIVESIFKSLGRSLRAAISKIETKLPTTKGVL